MLQPLVVESNPGGAVSIALGGIGQVEPTLSPPFYDVSIVEFGQSVVQQFVMTNGGAPPLQISSLRLDQVFGTGFSIDSTTCSGTLDTGASCEIDVRFTPAAFGQDSGALTMVTDHGTLSTEANWVMGYGAARLTVVLAGTGTGRVVSDGGGNPNIDCGTTCTGLNASSQTWRLTATPDAGSVFAGWSIPACGTSPVCDVPLSTMPTTVTATFN